MGGGLHRRRDDRTERPALRVPKAVRQDVRCAVVEAVVPGVIESAGWPITELLTDPAAAARRLREQLDAMA